LIALVDAVAGHFRNSGASQILGKAADRMVRCGAREVMMNGSVRQRMRIDAIARIYENCGP
jgi:hypothetical protein